MMNNYLRYYEVSPGEIRLQRMLKSQMTGIAKATAIQEFVGISNGRSLFDLAQESPYLNV